MTRSDDIPQVSSSGPSNSNAQGSALAGSPPDWNLVHFDVACARCGHDLRGRGEPKCPGCQLEFDWSAAVPLEKLTCAKCDYHLYGLGEARCPECGVGFDWNEALLDYRRKQKPLFEYRWREEPFRSLIRTWWRALRPGKFWREFDIHDPPQVKPLLVAPLLTPILAVMICWTAVPIGEWAVDWYRYSANAGLGFNLSQFSMYWQASTSLSSLWMGGVLVAVWLVSSLATLLILRQSMRRSRIRSTHALRAWAYSTCGLILPGLAAFLTYRLILYMLDRWSLPNIDIAAMIIVSVLIHSVWSLRCAYRHYLRMPHSLAIAVVAQAVAMLVSIVVCVLSGHRGFTQLVLALLRVLGLDAFFDA